MSLAGSHLEAEGHRGPVRVLPLAPEIGAEIVGVDLSRPFGEADFAVIHEAFLRHCVIVLRNQNLREDDQVTFAKGFGPLASTVNRNSGQSAQHSSSFLISNVRENGKLIGALPDGEMLFHSDQCYVERPCMAALLYSIEIPSHGGETIFANMYRAWETLPEDLKQAVEGRKAINIFEYNENGGYGQSAMQLYPQVPEGAKAYAHPIVRTHPQTGRKALYVNRGMTLCIEGMERSASDAILLRLFDHQEQPQFQYAHRWRVGDLIMWDNRCTLHARNDFPATERRILRRVTVLGEVPV
jgi:taurine dioxygenase